MAEEAGMADREEKSKKVTRRNFLKATGGAAALGMLGGIVGPTEAFAATAGVPKKWDQTCDVLVVGSGFAGFTAALEAKSAGADAVIIEKMPLYGGNSIINGGDFGAAGTQMQKEMGVEDSPELMLKDMLKAGAYLNHVELAKTVAYGSKDALEWSMNFCGAKFTRLNFHGGHSVRRSHQTENASGSGLIGKMMSKSKELGIKVMLRTKMVRFVVDKNGRIAGIEARTGYSFPDEKSGKPAFIRARKAVVLTSGGFSYDVALRQVHDPRLTDRFDSTNHSGATGEALLAACQAGAMDVQMDWIQLGPWTSPDEKGFGVVPLFCERLVGFGPMLNPATAKRFIKETGDRKVRADAIVLIGHPVVILGDSYAVQKQVVPAALEKGLANGAIKKFDTLEALARAYDIAFGPFMEEINKWNSYVEKKKDPEFDCMIFPDARPTSAPPFYAARLWPRVHHTMGGLVINKEAQVIGFDMKPIKGLYAAGEVTGGVHGAVRLGSVAMADCVVFGRIAGTNAAKEKA